jgi:hypothetical protein
MPIAVTLRAAAGTRAVLQRHGFVKANPPYLLAGTPLAVAANSFGVKIWLFVSNLDRDRNPPLFATSQIFLLSERISVSFGSAGD